MGSSNTRPPQYATTFSFCVVVIEMFSSANVQFSKQVELNFLLYSICSNEFAKFRH